ncbi:hypothetical protein [Ralstonia pseudosolanacearum]|uniref:hypothetical protein n=1 Tax=Ralstonia pseudosolanacearum TaxID=1310165 RepID=UPI001868CABC|nr:hypothetical protein [Ralstonia pseudosolanacearum]QOK94771.1 hypothetical protein HF908_25965 [Ralstonia pseudosolanacearum]UWD88707.1 hypothetical protein NY025_00785 [Ralstonia pseudosolanacearum]
MFKAETLCLPWACISACRQLAPDAGWGAMACGSLKKRERMHVHLCRFFRNLLRAISPNIPFRDHPASRSDRRTVLKGQPGDNGFESQCYSLKQVSSALQATCSTQSANEPG